MIPLFVTTSESISFARLNTDNDRYPDARPTGLREYLTAAHHAIFQS